MMRSAIDSEKLKDEVELFEEIQQVENLIHINKVRSNNEINFRLSYKEDILHKKLIPIVIITLLKI